MSKKSYSFLLAIAAVAILSITGCRHKADSLTYEGDIDNDIVLSTDPTSRNLTMTINSDGEWSVFSGSTENSIDLSQSIMGGSAKGTYILDVDNAVRNILKINTTQGKTIMAERKLPMEGGHNFRDLGGLKNKDGKRVKWGKFFRSDDLHSLTEADLKYLESIPLVSIVDFRSQSEIEKAPDKVPQTATRYELSISPGNLTDLSEDVLNMTNEQTIDTMKEINKFFVTDSACIAQYKEFFRLLQSEDHSPLLFHCSAGKDRTGMGAALILSALNVDEETIFEDYLQSNKNLIKKYESYIKQYPQLKALFGVRREFLQTGLDRIKQDHGSVENYLTNVLEVDIAKFRDLYLRD